jgi:multimeric flavodoxin WrbA
MPPTSEGQTVKILAINSSHRADTGHTRFLIDKLVQGALAAGAECEVVTLAKIKINRCLACNRCQIAGKPRRCVYDDKDGVRAIFTKMAEAGLIIYATPVYLFGMTGLLKTFLDRLHATGDPREVRLSRGGLVFHAVDPAICSKPFVSLVCCDNIEAATPKNVLEYFRTFSRFMDAPQVGELVRNAGRLAAHGQDPERVQRFPRLREVYAAYEQAGRELATTGRIRRATQRRANQEILPVPLFGVLKRLPVKAVKRRFVERAQLMERSSPQPPRV